MQCPKCESLLQISKSYLTFENDDTPDLPTKAFTNLDMVCANPHCDYFAGEDLTNPGSIVEILKNETT
jgi:hypothetical protein